MMRIIILLTISIYTIFADGGLLKVDWSSISTTKEKLRVIPKELKDKIKVVTLPVYIPNYYINSKNIKVVADRNFYAITVFLKNARLLVRGDRTYQIEDKKHQFKIVKPSEDRVIHAEGMATIDFYRHNIDYSMVLECDNPDIDKRCREDSFLEDLYRRLTFIGGTR